VTLVDAAKEEAERLGIQLLVNDPKRVLGVLDVQSNIAGFLNEEDQLVLEGVCAQIAAAIESTRLRQEMEDRLRELNALQRLMSHEGWRAFQATREQAPPAYLFDQTSIQTTTLEELWLQHNHETTQKELTRTSIESNGHIIARPIAVRGEIIGALGVQNDSDSPLASEDQAFLDAVAEQVAEALERARLLEQTQKRAIEMETVAQVSAVASTILNTEKLLQEVADLTKGSFGLYHTHIYLLNEMGNTLDLAAGAGAVGRQMMAQGWSIPLEREHSIVVRAARDQQAIIANDVQQSPDFMPNPLLPDTRSEMAIPLIVGDSILGVLDVQADSINRFTDEDIRVQTTLAAQVAAALRNASLYQQTQAALADFKQSQELLRTTIDATPDWIFIKDRDHRYRLVNQGYANSLHTTPDALIGKNDLEIGFPEDIVKGNQELGIRGFWPDDLEVIDSGKPKFIEVEPAFIDGRPIFLSTIKVPLHDTSGDVWGVLGFVRDITQREQLLAEVENLYKATRQINEAHDLQGIVAAAAEVRPLSIISRVLLFTFERNLLDQVEAMTMTANWHSGQGTPPPPVGKRYGQNAFSIVQMMLSPEPLFFNDVLHDERMDAPIIAVAQEQNIRAMVVLPLQVGGRELGALCLQAEEVHEFSSREIQFYLSLAPQIAVAIDNQRLLAESHSALAEVERTQRRYTLQAWDTYRDKLTTLSHEEVREGVNPLGNNLLSEINRTVAQSRRSRTNSQAQVILSDQPPENSGHQTQTDSSLIVPLTIRGETIGVLGLQEIDKERIWSPEEISLIGAICEQLAQAAENIRLIDETQQRAAREKQVNEIGEKIQAAQSLEEALKIAVKEVGLSLQTTQTIVQLDVK
jgi:PAS domain S-box-containing protein